MRMACQASSPAARRLMFQLKAQGHHEGQDTFEKRFAIAKQLTVGGFVLEIDGESPIFARLASGVAHRSPSGQMVVADDDPRWG